MRYGPWRLDGLLWLANLLALTTPLPSSIRIGAILTEDQKGSSTELAFKYAVHRLNRDRELLPKTAISYDIQYVAKDDSFHATKKTCQQVRRGVVAIFGPPDPILGPHIHSICDALDIPHLEARPDPGLQQNEFSINLHPSQKLLNRAFQDLMNFLNWTRVAIVYEDDFGLARLRELVKGTDVVLRQAGPGSYQAVLSDIKTSEIHNLVVDAKPANIHHFLRGILKLQMNDYKYHYLFTSFDVETFDLEDFKYNFVNMTAFRVVDASDLTVLETLQDMQRFRETLKTPSSPITLIQAEPALMYDSVMVFAAGLRSVESSHALTPANVSCEREHPWDGGLSLTNYINAVEWKGLTGPIEFKEGRRVHFKLDLLKLKQHAMVKVGEWTPTTGVNVTDRAAFFDPGTVNVTLVVITILETPYVMMRQGKNYTGNGRFYGFCVDVLERTAKEVGFDYLLDLVPDGKYGARDPITGKWNGMVRQLIDHEQPYVMMRSGQALAGNDRFEGFCIDLLRIVADMVGFDYRIELVPDGKYGVIDLETGQWNGIVRQLKDKKADLAVGSMTINYARESVIDFTKPFMNLGISILFKVPTSRPTRLFSFMNPLAVEIWLSALAAYVLVSLTMWLVAKFSAREWRDPHPCRSDRLLRNQFSLPNSFWFTIGTLMQQGSDLNPKAASTRIVGGIWWFFTLIIISSYTANLAAFLTVERMITPIENAEDLAGQTEISYGTLDSGSTMTFFRDSMIETYKKMWRFMENRKPSVFVSTYEEGVRRVLDGNYAFLMESTMLDFIVQRDCNLTQIGGLLDSKGYGIATPMGSPWRDRLSLAILELQERGEIQLLYDKWWKGAGDTCSKGDKAKESKASSLGVDNIGGVFVVLLCGLALAVLVAVLEFCWCSRKGQDRARQLGQSLCSEMVGELRFAIRCRASRQRPALRRECSRCLPQTYPYDIPPPPPPVPTSWSLARSQLDVEDPIGLEFVRPKFDDD